MNTGSRKRSDHEELRLRVRMLNSTHIADVLQKAKDELGTRGEQIGPLDVTRNPAVRFTSTLCTAHVEPAGVTGLDEGLSRLIGDSSSTVARKRYRVLGYSIMPTELRTVSKDAERYLVFCHYVGILCGWSARFRRPTVRVVTPDDLAVEYDADAPGAPIRIKHRCMGLVNGKMEPVVEVYDLSNLDAPAYRVETPGGVLVSEKTGDAYPWRFSDGTPYCRIVIYGRAENLARGLEIVEATLRVAVGWSFWWAGFRDACFKGRNVSGMDLAGAGSVTDPSGHGDGSQGAEIGPEDVARWVHTDPDKPGEHWQWDAPFDVQAMASAVTMYETQALSQLGFPVDLTATGGEPIAYEVEAREVAAHAHYDQLRAGDVEVLRILAAITNYETQSTGKPTNYPDGPDAYGVDYYEEFEDGDGTAGDGAAAGAGSAGGGAGRPGGQGERDPRAAAAGE